MKPLVLSSTFIFLSLKNELKIFLSLKIYENGRPTLKRLLLEPPTLHEFQEKLLRRVWN